MKLRTIATTAVVTLAALGAGAYLARDYLFLHLPGLLAPRVEPNHAVAWQQGPATATTAPAQRPPNVIFILADDLGFNDLTVNGGGIANGAVPTPNIDALLRQGARFTNGYAGNATCSPTRAALMTGRYPTRFGFEFTSTGPAFARYVAKFPNDSGLPTIFHEDNVDRQPPQDDQGVPASEITIAELLKGRGYHNVHLGKWHLGGGKGMRPEDQGFDESLGFIIGGQMYLPKNDPNAVNSQQDFDPIDKFLWANLPYSVQYNGGPRFAPNAYMTDYLTTQAVDVIKANRNRPFMMYLAYNAPHTPLQATRADYDALNTIDDSTPEGRRLRVYGAMVRALDRGVGRVMAELKAQGLDDNTMVVFTSDNGGPHYIGLPDINRPYRGWKITFFEGGIRVPFGIRWPAQIAAGTTSPVPVSTFDLFATAAAAGGAPLPADRVIDGVNLLPWAQGKGSGDPHAALFWRSGPYEVVQAGGWKLQQVQRPRRDYLFNLTVDPTEQTDVAAANPAKVAALTALIKAHDAQLPAPMWPSLTESPIPIDRPLDSPPKPGETTIYWSN
jgi:arylsulfatase A-like enzyme